MCLLNSRFVDNIWYITLFFSHRGNAYIANNLSLFPGQKHLWRVNKCRILWNSFLVSFFIFQLQREHNAEIISLLWIIFCFHLKCLVLINIRKKPTHATGQSVGILGSLITWCDHGRETAFSLWLLILFCALHLQVKSTKSHGRFSLKIYEQDTICLIRHHQSPWGKCVLTSLTVAWAWDIVTTSWLVTVPEYHVCCCETDWDWKACVDMDMHVKLAIHSSADTAPFKFNFVHV